MEKNNSENGFTYTYSAKEQAEVKRIRDKYTATPEIDDKMARLRRLDASVTKTARIFALIFGIVGVLLLGFGMSIIMTEIGDNLFSSREAVMIVGILLGILGGSIASAAYPVYNAIIKVKRNKIAPEIIKLTDELMK